MNALRYVLGRTAVVVLAAVVAAVAFGQGLEPIELPKPDMDGGKPLMRVLKERQTIRSFSEKKLPLQVMSDLLWAAFGINRPEAGKRTAPSANDRQEIDIYVATAGGVYVYAAKEHALKPVLAEDIRAMTGTQDYVAGAPVNLVYVADNVRGRRSTEEAKLSAPAANTGFIAQNVYLFCASEGLATVVRGSIDKEALATKLGLTEEQTITLAQTVGYPGE